MHCYLSAVPRLSHLCPGGVGMGRGGMVDASFIDHLSKSGVTWKGRFDGAWEHGGFNPFMLHPKYVKYWKNANMNVSRLGNTTAGSLQCNGDVKAMSLCTLQETELGSNALAFMVIPPSDIIKSSSKLPAV